MLDFDLSQLYQVETKRLNEQVRRNIDRFPERFMFQLSMEEWDLMRTQIATASEQNKRRLSNLPYAFTEHGVTMLASVLKSQKAIQMNIAIVDAFISLKTLTMNNEQVILQPKEIERKYDKQFNDVFEAINYLLQKDKKLNEQKQRIEIGYKS